MVFAGGFLVWIAAARIQRAEHISGLAEPAVVDRASPTGYAAGLRRLIVPEHNNESYQWIAQTQQMLARGQVRIRHVDYDNAPLGRDVRTPSPYRWWLGLVAWSDHVISGRPLAQAAEHAALFADPALQLALLVAAVLFAVWQFGVLPASLLAFGWAALFPFAGTFLAVQAGDSGLVQVCAFCTMLPLVAALTTRPRAAVRGAPPANDARRHRQWFCAAGIAGGLGLWVNLQRELPILIGVSLGALFAVWVAPRPATSEAGSTEVGSWRTWALGGAATVLVAYVIEYFPAHMDWRRLETVHPLFGLGWLGIGELLEQVAAWRNNPEQRWTVRRVAIILLAVLPIAAIPILINYTGSNRFTLDDAFASRLSNLPESPAAQNLWAWLVRDGLTFKAAATMLPLLILGPALWFLTRRGTGKSHRQAIAVALGPVLVALGFACFQLGWWSLLDGALLTLLIAFTTPIDAMPKAGPWVCLGGLILVLAPGAMLLWGQARAEKREVLAEGDVIALIERDLAYWLSNQAGPSGAVVLAPPSLTTSLYFHGGLSGLSTPYWENRDGFAAAVRIAGATSPEEAQATAQARNLAYIIIPSWDPFMDEYARLGSRQPDRSLVALLHQWLPPRWLRPVPYHLPRIAGFEGLSVAIFQVTDVQDNPTALGRLAEYFVEMEQLEQAALVGEALTRLFPTDLGAWVSRSLVEQARGNTSGFATAIKELPTHLAQGEEEALPWDRRVSLAIALAEGKYFELAKEQTNQCLSVIDEARVRSLTTVSLYRLQVLSKAFGLEIADPKLRALSRALLPAEMRGNL